MVSFFIYLPALLITFQAKSATFPIERLYRSMDQVGEVIRNLQPGGCEVTLKRVFEELQYTEPSQYEKTDLIREAERILVVGYETRKILGIKLKDIDREQQYSGACAVSARRAIRVIRGLEDYLGHITVKSGKKLQLPAEFQKDQIELKSGDLILSRGRVFTSGTIARLADEQMQFSHLSVFYIDPKTGRKFTIEAHMESGAHVIPYEKFYEDGKIRSTVYRYQDPDLAHKAAAYMFQKVKSREDAGNVIPYDIQIDHDDHSRLFCTEVAREGFKAVTHQEVLIPLHSSTFSGQNRVLFDQLGAVATEAFMPGDIEVDPRFEMVQDWRNFNEINIAWTHDAIMTKSLEWLQTNDYTLHSHLGIDVLAWGAWLGRRMPLVGEKLGKTFSRDVKKDMISGTLIMFFVNRRFEKMLKILDRNQVKRTGYPMTITQQMEALEYLRALKPRVTPAFKPGDIEYEKKKRDLLP